MSFNLFVVKCLLWLRWFLSIVFIRYFSFNIVWNVNFYCELWNVWTSIRIWLKSRTIAISNRITNWTNEKKSKKNNSITSLKMSEIGWKASLRHINCDSFHFAAIFCFWTALLEIWIDPWFSRRIANSLTGPLKPLWTRSSVKVSL